MARSRADRSRSPVRTRPEAALTIPPVPPPAAEDVPAAAAKASTAVLSSFMRLWAVQQALILMFTKLARRENQMQALLVAAAFVYPSPAVSLAALGSRIWADASLSPFVWESHLWCARGPARVDPKPLRIRHVCTPHTHTHPLGPVLCPLAPRCVQTDATVFLGFVYLVYQRTRAASSHTPVASGGRLRTPVSIIQCKMCL